MGCSSSVQTSGTVVENQNQNQQAFQGNLTFGASTHKVAESAPQDPHSFPVPFDHPPEPQPQIHVQPVIQVQQTPQTQEGWVFQPTPGQPDVVIPPDETDVNRDSALGVRYMIGEVSQVLKAISVSLYDAKGHIPEIEAKIKKENRYLKTIEVNVDMENDDKDSPDYYITDLLKTGAYTKFNFTFYFITTCSEQALKTMGESIVRHGLEKLTLMECANTTNDKFFEHVLSGLKKNNNNKSLKYFKMDFIDCPEVTDESIRHIKEAVESNQALEHFDVYFGKSTHLTEKSIGYIKAALQNKPNLKRLGLGFQRMKQFTDAVLPVYLEIIKACPQLTYLDFMTPEASYTDAAFTKFETSVNALNIQNCNILWKEPQYF